MDSHTVEADSDPQTFDLAIAWAASLRLAADDDVVLAIKLPSGALRTFVRKGQLAGPVDLVRDAQELLALVATFEQPPQRRWPVL